MIKDDYLENKMMESEEAARELAADAGIDLADVQGTGTDGQILKSDVEKAIEEVLGEPIVEWQVETPMPEFVTVRMKPERSVKLENRLVGPGKEVVVSRSIADWLIGIDYAVIVRG
jgi:pyruvate/2-oxoglutarate dehydrogenase complex dihydrolipoamide acyltransferase (E2) component